MSDVACVSNARIERKVGPLRIAYLRRAVSSLIWFLVVVAAVAHCRSSVEQALGERLAHEYEKQVGLGGAPELDGISRYISSVGSRVASVLPSHPQYHFVFDPNPAFKSAFALPGGYIIVGGELLATAQTEDELANALAHEIEHVELGQVSRRVSELEKQKKIENLEVSELWPGYTKEEELACDLNGQKLAAKAGYSPAGMLTLLETFKALRKGDRTPSPADWMYQGEGFDRARLLDGRKLAECVQKLLVVAESKAARR